MKKRFLGVLIVLFASTFASAAFAKSIMYEASGKVTSVDPLYSRITIDHGAIKGFSGDETTEFAVEPVDLLKKINKNDLVDFEIVDKDGDVFVDKLTKTGVAEPEAKVGAGKVVQDVLVGTGEVAKGITTPITPAHDVVSGAVDATTGATGAVLNNADTKVKKNF